MTSPLPTIDDIREAATRILPYIHRTPVLSSRQLNAMFNAEIFFKCENLQKVGAFKARGACNAVFQLDESVAVSGVVTHSSGNHAQALAYAAGLRGIMCTIVMPSNAPDVKKSAVRGYGATIIECEPTLASRLATMQRVVDETGAHPVPPYDDARVIAGQGTAALELMEDHPDLDVVMAPVGGGGLLSGTAIAVNGVSPPTIVIGAEPANVDDAKRSMESGVLQPPPTGHTIADGLRTALGALPFEILKKHNIRIETCSEGSILEGLSRIMERLKVVIEPSAAVTLGVMLEHPELVSRRRVGVILCGGNLDLRSLSM